MKKQYRVVAPYLAWGNVMAFEGEVRDDIPAESVGWLLDQGHIAREEGNGPSEPSPAPENGQPEPVEGGEQ